MGLTRPPDIRARLRSFERAPFTTSMAGERELTARHLRRLVADGAVKRVLKGVYVEAGVPDDLDLRIAALRLHAPPDTVVCDRHAAWLHGAEMVLAPGEHLEAMPVRMLRRRGSASLRNPVSVRGERDLRDSEIVELNGLAVTTPMRTCADLGMVRWPSESLAGMNAMYRTGLVDKDRLLALSSGFKGRRWVTTFRAVAPLVHDRCESPPEDILWLRCHEAGLDLEPQVELWDGSDFVARFDLADPELKFAVEYDGAQWHSDPDQLEHDRRRRERARALGWVIVVIRAEDLFAQTLRAEELIRAGHRTALARADHTPYAA